MRDATRQPSSTALVRSMLRCATDRDHVVWLTVDGVIDAHANCTGHRDVPDWILTRLQQALRERTDTVDAIVHRLLSPPTRARYRRWLCDFYRFIAPVETCLLRVPTLAHALPERFKSSLLASDLLALELTPAECSRLAPRYCAPSLCTTATALGWLFVIERAVLPVGDLRARLEPALALELEIAGSFVTAYSRDGMQRWLELARLIESTVWDDEDMTELVCAAETALAHLQAILAWDRSTLETPAGVTEGVGE